MKNRNLHPKALQYWRDKGYTQGSVESISELMVYLEDLLKICEDNEMIDEFKIIEIREKIFLEKLTDG